jgi:hypothetical protein
MHIQLKSTRQPVYLLPHTSVAVCPYSRDSHVQILVPYPLSRRGNRGYVTIVKHSSLKKEKI